MNQALPDVRLRVPTDEDAFAWHRIFADPEVMEFHGGKAAELSVYEELTARQRRHDAELGFCLWTMVGPEGEVLGFTGAQPWPRAWGPRGEIEIGWRLGRAHWGKGYVTAAALTTLERVRAAGVSGVVAMVRPGNERSIAVTRRLGMESAEVFAHPTSAEPAHCYRLAL
ncbi:GNAT family N-acetyltransferase [Streptomyces sp. NBC_01340]|uniref:GNAT family N-acetyltransferase n=1 Tax=unclassified Streptomyces TaxID=2593676 RepID=UPI00224C88ED|nr:MULTISPECIES: GNAT family N-acetyltransferase [unclassified Streptomyces]MCX4456017.1 GNAT family N-acetyltransferase [Streptomyces sp. NBC_01719]MCX4495376.1 GNAT family N-acetyltransferase [Streptomyces sp. NBC_01728]MCX4590062.1 GNAT family N-acetyltransferase [Streptomyces sp. NBC_01549]WSI40340.1 GNAT family N-acetyltransferase [Streptomyces sp. NBC_01340]